MKRIFAIIMTICLMASVLSVPAFALKEAPTPIGAVLRVSAQKKDGTSVAIPNADFTSFEQGWEAAILLAMNGDKMDAEGYDRVVVDLLDDWNANSKGEFGDSDLEGFRQSTIYCPSGVRLTINMNGHTIDRDLEEEEYDGEVIAIGDNANVIINGGKSGDPIIKKDEVAAEGMIGTITGGWSCNGAGGIHIADKAVVTLNNVNVTGNAVEDEKGAGIAVYDGSSLVMNGGKISDNRLYLFFDTFERTEGALYVDGATVVLNDVIISGNSADDGEILGVALSLNSNCKVTLNRCHVFENAFAKDQKCYSIFYLDDAGCELEVNDSYIINNGRPIYSVSRGSRSTAFASNGKLTFNRCEIKGNQSYMLLIAAQYASAVNTFNECVITDNPCGVLCSVGNPYKSSHTFIKCRFNNNNPTKDAYVEASFEGNAAADIKLIDCEMGDSTYKDKDEIEFINTTRGRALAGSLFGEGSLVMIISILALVVSVVSICLTIAFSKKKTAPASADTAAESKDRE